MVFSDNDRAVIEACFREKGWRGARIVKEFPGKKWSRQIVNRLVKTIEDTGSTSRQSGSGRPRTARTDENKDKCRGHDSVTGGHAWYAPSTAENSS